MATVVELFADRTETLGDRSSAEIAYVVSDAVDEADVKAAALVAVPSYYGIPKEPLHIIAYLTVP